MKIALLILCILCSALAVAGQAVSSGVEITTTYSQNERFYLKSVPFDSEFPSLRGKTFVYEKGRKAPLYVFERGFDSVDEHSNNLILSNTGEVILYVIPWGADDEREGLKSVTIYKQGQILKSFTEAELTGCDKQKERCSLVYSNYDKVVDKEKSRWGTGDYKKAFVEGVDEREKFLSDFPIFSHDDTVYLTDSKKRTHLFDLKEGGYLRSDSFDNLYERIRDKGRFNKTECLDFDAPTFLDFPKLKDGGDTYARLAAYLDMKPASNTEKSDQQYKLYSFKMNSTLSRGGGLEIEDFEFYDELPKEKIVEFFRINKFDGSSIPKAFEKWYLGEQYFFFRKKNPQLARRERQLEKIEERARFEERLTAEKIDEVYIPKNLGECLIELDKRLTEIDKGDMRALPARRDMIRYHLGLGTWMRNNWGLWGGSRLQKYFQDRGVTHPESMSSVVLYHYHDWLNGKTETWKEWEALSRRNRSSSGPARH